MTRRKKPPPGGETNREAVDATIAALGLDGEPASLAVVTAARRLAAQVDAEPSRSDLWARYADALEALEDHGNGDGDTIRDLLAELTAAGDPGVGDPPSS